MTDSNVISLSGDPINSVVANETCVRVLEEWLERAKSGEVIGFAIVGRHHDQAGSFAIAGSIGGYSMLGALETAKADIVEILRNG